MQDSALSLRPCIMPSDGVGHLRWSNGGGHYLRQMLALVSVVVLVCGITGCHMSNTRGSGHDAGLQAAGADEEECLSSNRVVLRVQFVKYDLTEGAFTLVWAYDPNVYYTFKVMDVIQGDSPAARGEYVNMAQHGDRGTLLARVIELSEDSDSLRWERLAGQEFLLEFDQSWPHLGRITKIHRSLGR